MNLVEGSRRLNYNYPVALLAIFIRSNVPAHATETRHGSSCFLIAELIYKSLIFR
jgi:hypothetical protein